jgi:hypothetical protein
MQDRNARWIDIKPWGPVEAALRLFDAAESEPMVLSLGLNRRAGDTPNRELVAELLELTRVIDGSPYLGILYGRVLRLTFSKDGEYVNVASYEEINGRVNATTLKTSYSRTVSA